MRQRDQRRMELWLTDDDIHRLDVIAAAYGFPRAKIVRAAIKAAFIHLGMDDPISPVEAE